MTGAVPPEEEVTPPAPVETLLEEFRDDEVLEEGTPHGREVHGLLGFYGKKGCGKGGVVEIEFRGFADALAEVPVIGLKEEDDVPRFQHREPLPGGIVGDAGFAGEIGQIQHLSSSCSGQREEFPEGVQIPHIHHLPHVPLQIGTNVVLSPYPCVQVPVMHRWVEAGKQYRIQRHLPQSVPQFPQAEGQKLQIGRPSRKALADPGKNPEPLTSREYPSPGWHEVQDLLQVGEQIRGVLDFIQHGALGKPVQKAPGVFPGMGTHIQVFQRRIRHLRKGRHREGGLPGLPGTGQDHGRVLGCKVPKRLQ